MKAKRPFKALPHQQQGTEFLSSRTAAALFDEQGLGKTKQLIDAIVTCIGSGSIQGAVVVCPNNLKSTWRDEILKHAPGERTVVLGAGKAARRQALGNLRGTFYIVNYEAVPREVTVLRALLRFKRFAFVLDESHRIKNSSTAVTQAIHELRGYAARRYILTGTPVANTPDDIWSQVYFLDGGDSLGRSMGEFRDRFGDAACGYTNMDALAGHLTSLGLRRTKAKNLKLPLKSFVRIPAPLAPRQAVLYDGLRKRTKKWVEGLSGKQVLQQSDNVLTKLGRLVELASNPRLVEPGYREVPGKFVVLDDLLAQRFVQEDAKVIVWTSFVANVDELCRRYGGYGAVSVHGELSTPTRELAVRRFRNDPKVRLLVANPAAAREGLTLVEARTAIYMDRGFNLVDYLQSQDRIHRIGQTRPCEIIILIAPGTIDEYVDFAIEQKARVAQYVQSDRASIRPDDLRFKKPAVLKALLA